MANLTHAERRAKGLAMLAGIVGSNEEAAAIAQRLETSLGALGSYAVDWAFGDIWARPGLKPPDREFVVLSQLATLGQLDQLRSHVDFALRQGLRESQIAEVFVQLGGYAGFPRAISAMRVAQEVFAEQGRGSGLDVEPAAPKDDDQRRADAREVIGRLSMNQPEGGIDTGMGSFTGTAGRWAFGELWSREALTRRERSLVVVGTLVAQGKLNELRFHARGAINHGVSIEELEEVMTTTIVYVGFPTAVEGFRVLRQVEGQVEEQVQNQNGA
jgi:4-carboxymuconolactone decarboxylase